MHNRYHKESSDSQIRWVLRFSHVLKHLSDLPFTGTSFLASDQANLSTENYKTFQNVNKLKFDVCAPSEITK